VMEIRLLLCLLQIGQPDFLYIQKPCLPAFECTHLQVNLLRIEHEISLEIWCVKLLSSYYF
jgi:hypothetical protein